jgi:serine protease Do
MKIFRKCRISVTIAPCLLHELGRDLRRGAFNDGEKMKSKILLLALASTICAAGLAQAETLTLTGKMRWLTLASTKDKDQAIGIAQRISGIANIVKVVSSKSGFYGVIAGPYAANTIKDIKKADTDSRLGDLPKDAYLTQGANYIETVWQAKASDVTLVAYSVEKTAEFSSGTLNVKIKGEKLGAEHAYSVIDGKDNKGTFHFDIGKDLPQDDLASAESFLGLILNEAAMAKLVVGASSPQVIVTNNSGGAHCCTTTTFFSRDTETSSWTKTVSPALDGGGYGYEDVDGDGVLELMSVDNNFLYAFDSYAGSFAPLKIHRLKAGKIVDATDEPVMRPRLVQDLAGMEYDAKIQPEIWKYNGFLAGWVAAKIRLGQGDAAWATFMRNYQKDNGFGPQECTSGQSIEKCPEGNLKTLPIPKGLAMFLRENGYAPLPAAAQKELN